MKEETKAATVFAVLAIG